MNNINNWQRAEYIDKEAFQKHSVSLYEKNFASLNNLIGYIEINKSNNIFKTLDMSAKRNKGRRCVTDGKSAVIKQLNIIVGHEKFNKLNTKIKTAPYLCVFLEFIIRYYNYKGKNNKQNHIQLGLILLSSLYINFNSLVHKTHSGWPD